MIRDGVKSYKESFFLFFNSLSIMPTTTKLKLQQVTMTMMTRSFFLLTIAFFFTTLAPTNNVDAIDLTSKNWDEQTAGKTVFIKFFAPWCGHCKAMKPAWDQLMGDFKDSKTTLVADVDCTAEENQELCAEHGVEGFPTLKYGNPDALEDYEGERDYDALKDFADEELKPTCSPYNMDLCNDEEKAQIQKYFDMIPGGELQEMLEEKEGELVDLEDEFADAVEKLQEQYQALIESYNEQQDEFMKSGYKMMKAVLGASKQKSGSSNEEL